MRSAETLVTCFVIAVVFGALAFIIGAQFTNLMGALEFGSAVFLVVFFTAAFLGFITPILGEEPSLKKGAD